MNGKGQNPPKVLVLSEVGNANGSNLSGEKRALRADQVSIEYRQCRPSIDGLAIEYWPTCMLLERRLISTNKSAECRSTYPAECSSTYRPSVDRHIGRVSIEILVECRSRYRSSVDRYIGQVSIDISAKCRSTYRSSVDRYVGRLSIDISVE